VTAPVRSTGDPNVDAVAVAVASFGLPGSRVVWPAHPLGDEAWHALLAACAQEHIVGLLGASTASGALAVDRGHRSGLEALLTEWRERSARLERDTLELSRRLDRAGIDHRIVDGPVVAHRAYRPAGRRLYAAVDVLVADHVAARDDLDDLPSGRRLRLTTDLLAGAGPVVADLAAVRPHVETVRVGGLGLPSLPIDAQLVATCVAPADGQHASLATLRDIAQLALGGNTALGGYTALGNGADVHAVIRWADRWQVTDRVAEAVRRSWAVFDLADKIGISTWAVRYESTSRHRPPGRGWRSPRRLPVPFFGSLWSQWRPQRSNIRDVGR
jgi:hypothetical protein